MPHDPVRRVGVIGDIHAEDQSLAAALAFLRAQQVDAILAVGDITDGVGSVDRCCDLLRASRALAVAGNHDRWFSAGEMRTLARATPAWDVSDFTSAWLRELPSTRTIATVAGAALLCHGMGDVDMDGIWPADSDESALARASVQKLLADGAVSIVVAGHTHQRMVRSLRGVTFINAGTLVQNDNPCLAVIDFERRVVEFFDVHDEGSIVAAETFHFDGRIVAPERESRASRPRV